MASERQCIVHLCKIKDSKDASVFPLTAKTEENLRRYISRWAGLDGECQAIANKLISERGSPEQIVFTTACGCHRVCYSRFCDKTRVAAAEKRMKKALGGKLEEMTGRKRRSQTNISSILAPKRQHANRNASFDNLSVFGSVCILCRTDHYITDSHTKIRKLEKLVQCQTFEANSLLLTRAEEKRDDNLLLLLKGEDLIAKEAKYHRSCYQRYTKPYTASSSVSSCGNVDDIYQVFCDEIIKGKLRAGEVLDMNTLTKLYSSIYCRLNDTVTDQSVISNRTLKLKLQRTFPDLIFIRLTNVRWSELVMFADVSNRIDAGNDTGTEESDEEVDSHAHSSFDLSDENLHHLLYHSAMCLKRKVNAVPEMTCQWPPFSDDLSVDAANSMTPDHLYNFIAWVVGFSQEVPEVDEHVKLKDHEHRKVLSICQDIIYVASRGRRVTPKHLALGLTVRHLTGNLRLVSILSGLGHTPSRQSILDYDTAIAQYRSKSASVVPAGFVNRFTTIVYDNNDFGEETLSGKGTTHCTNGIIVQRQEYTEPSANVIERIPIPRVRGRCLQVPNQAIGMFTVCKRQGPTADFSEVHSLTQDQNDEVLKQSMDIDAAYVITKLPALSDTMSLSTLPGWTGFNTQICDSSDVPCRSRIGYLPVIEGSPTRFDVVNEILQRSKAIADRLEQEAVVVVVDQAIYCKAQHIRWQNEDLEKRLVIRLGEFHTAMAFLGTICKRFQDAGLRDIIIESGVAAEGSVTGILSGHHYNRSIRIIKLIFEGLHRLLMAAYLASLDDKEKLFLVGQANALRDAFNSQFFSEAVSEPDFQKLLSKIDHFARAGVSSSPTFSFWFSFLKMVKILLAFVRATRTGNWTLHLAAIRQMLPWFFAFDRVNYARFGTVYWLEMKNLPTTHPTVHQHLQDGQFVVQRSEQVFAQTAMDQTIEQTLNRDSKTKGGLTGITLNPAAVHRWILSFADRASICMQCEDMAGKQATHIRERKELDATRIRRDEEDVGNIINTIESQFNPFSSHDDNLVNIYTGTVAPDSVADDMCNAESIGEKALQNFMAERLVNKQKDLFVSIKFQRLKTFGYVGKINHPKPDTVLRASSQLLVRMLFIAKVKGMDMRDVLSYSLCPVPPSLGNYDGTTAKTNKAKLMQHLASLSTEVTSIPSNSAWILDGMAFLHQMVNVPPTFGELASAVLKQIVYLAEHNHTKRVDFVTDRYPLLSIKGSERALRGDTARDKHCQGLRIHSSAQKTPHNFKKFLSRGANKEALVQYLYQEWQKVDETVLHDVKVFLAHEDKCHSFSVLEGTVAVHLVDDLVCDHEEADTRMFLHAQHAFRNGYKTVVLRCFDTDVFAIAVSLGLVLHGEIYLSMGTKANCRNHHISKIDLSCEVRKATLGFHVFTGCDSTSCFKGKGKLKGFQLMMSNKLYTDTFTQLGMMWEVSKETSLILEQFVCHLYGHPEVSSLLDARCKIFKTSFRSDSSLPPTLEELTLHIRRVNYQVAIHKRSLLQQISAPHPTLHGWCIEEDLLTVQWTDQPLAPEQLLDNISCNCRKTECASNRCKCRAQAMKCSELCTCQNCVNSSLNAAEDENNELEQMFTCLPEEDVEEELEDLIF